MNHATRLHRVKRAAVAAIERVPQVGQVVRGSPRDLPSVRDVVFMRGVDQVTTVPARGTVSRAQCDVGLVVETASPQPARDSGSTEDDVLDDVEDRAWQIVAGIAEHVDSRLGGTVMDCEVLVTSEEAGAIGDLTVCRVHMALRCSLLSV